MRNTVKSYVKQPVVIEAIQFTDNNPPTLLRVSEFFGSEAKFVQIVRRDESIELVIPTLEGNMRASIGDYIIRGVKGEYYPCKPDVFEETYKEAKGPERLVKGRWT
jgi:hypothetical protein